MRIQAHGPQDSIARSDESPAQKVLATCPRGARIVRSTGVVDVVYRGVVHLVDVTAGHRIALTGTGSRVWSSLADSPTFPLLVERLRDDVTRTEQLLEDAARIVETWHALGLIEWR